MKIEEAKINWTSRVGIIIIFGIVVMILYIGSFGAWKDTLEQEKIVKIESGQTFDSTSGKLFENSKEGDFQWQATGYQYGGIGTIHNTWSIGNPRFGEGAHPSMHVKIDKTNLGKVTKKDCESAEYGLNGEFESHYNIMTGKTNNYYSTKIKDGEIICFSIEKNKDGIWGDKFIAIKIINHTDASDKSYAESMNFAYKMFE